MSHPSNKAMVAAAKRLHHKDGEVEIDDHDTPLPTARVSRGEDPGAYVLAWVWVDNSDVNAKDRRKKKPCSA